MRYEIILEYLDNVNERFAHLGLCNASQLHLALAEAVDVDGAISDYYHYLPSCDDGGFLRELVEACRASCGELAGYSAVRSLVVREARRADVLALNHVIEPRYRNEALRRWAQLHFRGEARYSWFELTGAATSSLTVHMLLSQAAEPHVNAEEEVRRAWLFYFPEVALLSTMLDSYVDKAADVSTEQHSYIGHYPGDVAAAQRLSSLIRSTFMRVRTLRRGYRHTVIVAAMIALYLSDDNARAAHRRRYTKELARAGGPLTRLLIPILRTWRVVYNLRTA